MEKLYKGKLNLILSLSSTQLLLSFTLRSHNVIENEKGIYVELMEINDEKIASDNDTCNERCAQDYNLHHVKPTLQT